MGDEPFSDQLRRAVAESGMSRYAIAKQINTSQATLSRFMSGERGLTMAVVDRLCLLLGVTINTRRKSKPQPKRTED
jgi:transcriptional regulator with XRE-family HTH domain